jgi:YesN/AraC family two-component response regulator
MGVDFIKSLKASVKFQRIKVVLISGYLLQEDVLGAIRSGVKNVLVKPFNRKQLIEQVCEVLKIDLPDDLKAS